MSSTTGSTSNSIPRYKPDPFRQDNFHYNADEA